MKWIQVFSFALFIFLTPASASHFEYKLNVESYYGTVKELTLGYDQWGTDGIDPALGEVPLPPYATEYDARFRIPCDTSITTHKDIRFGCGHTGGYDYTVEWKNTYQATISGNSMQNSGLWEMYFINPTNGNTLAHFQTFYNDSVYYVVPSNIKTIIVRTYHIIPLSWPIYNLYTPNGGELIQAGSTYNITLEPQSWSPYLNIELSTNGGTDWSYVAQNINGATTSYAWDVPNVSSNNCLINVGSRPCAYDKSEGSFIIYQGTPPQVAPVDFPVLVSNGTGLSKEIRFGMHPDATIGIDPALGEESISLSPSGTFDAAFRFVSNGQPTNILSSKDYQRGHNLYRGVKTYILALQPSPDSIVTISGNLPEGVSVNMSYLHYIGNGLAMLDTTQLTGAFNFTFPSGTTYNIGSPKIYFRCNFDWVTPVELSSFDAAASDNSVILRWSTASEKNNKGFEIQRKGTYGDWMDIIFVEGKGTTAESNTYSYTDAKLQPDIYLYRLKQIDFDGTASITGATEVTIENPAFYKLGQNYPNPFNPSTIISFTLPVEGRVSLKLFDMLGREVGSLVNEERPAGTYDINFNAYTYSLSSGIYFYRLSSGAYSSIKKMIYLK